MMRRQSAGVGVVRVALAGAWPLVTVCLLLLAGCTASPDPSPGADGAGAGGPAPDGARTPLVVADGKGAIRGLVVDEAVRPMAGVDVSVARIGGHVQTGKDGLFAFTDLAPGLYVVEAARAGYDGAQLQVQVAPGKDPPLTKMVLAATPSLQPYIDAFAIDLFHSFQTPFIGLGSIFDRAVSNGTISGFGAGLDRTATTVQMELGWQATLPTAEHQALVGATWIDPDLDDSQKGSTSRSSRARRPSWCGPRRWWTTSARTGSSCASTPCRTRSWIRTACSP